MTEDWNTTDELKKQIITAVYHDINDQIEEMIEDINCPRSYAEGLLKSIADNFKDETNAGKNTSSYSSRHASTPEHERGAEAIVRKHEKKSRKESSDVLNFFKEKVKPPKMIETKDSLYSSRHVSTHKNEKDAEEIVTKNEKKIRKEMKEEKEEK